jgi:hypothetical protein
MLLALVIEDSRDWRYDRVFFSVVHHPGNIALRASIRQFRTLIGKSEKFCCFTPDILVQAAERINDDKIWKWLEWYKDLYFIE